MFAFLLPEFVIEVTYMAVERFCSRGSLVASIAESAKSSPNRQSFETIMNCSAQSYSTRFTVNGERSIGKKAEGAARIRRHRC